MFCTNCGKEVPDGSEFCEFCGTKMKQKEEITKNDVSIEYSNTPVNVTFQRKKSFIGCAVSMKIHVDGVVVAQLSNGAAQQVQVPSGKHEIIVEMWSAVNKFELEFSPEHKNVIVEVGLKMGLITNKTRILSVRNVD